MGETGNIRKEQMNKQEKIGLSLIAVVIVIAIIAFEILPLMAGQQQPELTREEFVFVPFTTEGTITVESESDLLSVGLEATNLPNGLTFVGWEIDGHKNYAKNSGFTMHKNLAKEIQVKAIATTNDGSVVSQELNLLMTG